MQTTIDAAGRVVIPASIRNQVGLKAGTKLEVLVDDFSIRLVRAVAGPTLVRIGNRLVARPTVDSDSVSQIDFAALIDEERNRWPW